MKPDNIEVTLDSSDKEICLNDQGLCNRIEFIQGKFKKILQLKRKNFRLIVYLRLI